MRLWLIMAVAVAGYGCGELCLAILTAKLEKLPSLPVVAVANCVLPKK